LKEEVTKVINLFGGPGVGKSSVASGILYNLKRRHISCDAPYEFPKQLAWDNNESAIRDQLYVLANQHRGIVKSYGKVDYIILDSPILLSLVYKNEYTTKEYPSNLYNDTFNELVLELHNSYNSINYFLERGTTEYNTKERYQSLEDSLVLDSKIKQMLMDNDINYQSIIMDKNPSKQITKQILNESR